MIVKKQFGYAKVVYRGIEKNLNRCYVLFASANLLLCASAGRTEDLCRGYTPFLRKIRETRQKEVGNDGHNGLIFHNFIKNRIETI